MWCRVFFLISGCFAAAREYAVSPTEEAGGCPQTAQPCLPLTHYFNDSAEFSFTGALLSFLPGVHCLPQREDGGAYIIRDAVDLVLIGPSDGKAVIRCSGSAGLGFVNVTGLILSDITVENCGVELTGSLLGSTTNPLDTNLLGQSIPLRTALFFSLITSLSLSRVIVRNNTGYGAVGVNLIGNTTISGVEFTDNNLPVLQDSRCIGDISKHCKGGNLVMIFTDTHSTCPDTPIIHTVSIRDSMFKLGVDLTPAFSPFLSVDSDAENVFYGGGGVGLTLAQSTYGVEFVMDNSTLSENIAYTGSNLYVNIFDHAETNSSVTISNSKINYGNKILASGGIRLTGVFVLASGFSFAYGLEPPPTYTPLCTRHQRSQSDIFKIENSQFIGNQANLVSAGLMYLWTGAMTADTRRITLHNSTFHGNRGESVLAIFEISHSVSNLPFQIFLSEMVFSNNEIYDEELVTSARSFQQETVVTNSVKYIQFSDCLFSGNEATAIRISDSNVYMNGTNRFIGNTATFGGGLQLEEGSKVYLEPLSFTVFQDNRATTFGGAVYAVIASYTCFFQLLSANPDRYPRLVFQNNTAGSAGNAVYGNVDNCLLEYFNGAFTSDAIFSNISTFVDHPEEGSLVSSNGHRLCLCGDNDSNPNCNISFLSHEIDTFPGQKFTVSVAVRGYDGRLGDGFTPATLITDFVENETAIGLAPNQLVQEVRQSCSQVSFNFYASSQTVTINLLAPNGRVFNTFPIIVTLLPCPPGFKISNETQTQCVCNDLLQARGVSCNINTLMVSRNRDLWIGITNRTGQTEAIFAECPRAFCVQDSAPVSLYNPDEQCLHNRSGVLCGECQEGMSVGFGSSRCFVCSNLYLLLLLLFAFLGVLLIVLLSAVNLTVATGMINGLLFYANIVKVTNLRIYTPEYGFLIPFSIFINWLNLDFGIETCFYNGFNEYVKSWLQYIFPFYLFFLMGLAIFISSRSMKISKVLPRNIVAVFATVLLISYTKLLRTALVPFPFSRLYTSLDTFTVAWLYGGSHDYFGRHHAPLIIFSMCIVIVLILPYISLLATYPFLQKLNGKEGSKADLCFTWIRLKLFRLKPILDAYDAPLKDGHRYWTGLLLILRTVIFFTAALTLATGSSAVLNSATVVLVSVVLLGMILIMGVYTEKRLRGLECIHYVNLALLEFVNLILELVVPNDGAAKAAVLSASIAVAILLFLYAIAHQIFKKFEKRFPVLEKLNVEKHIKKFAAGRHTGVDGTTAATTQNHIDIVLDEIDNRRSSYDLEEQVTSTVISIKED